MTVAFDFVAALLGLRPPAAATKSRPPRTQQPGRNPLNFRGALSRQPGPALFPSFNRLGRGRDTQMMHPDHYYLIMSLLKYGTLGLALTFAVRLVAFTFNYLWWASLG